jgi:hypothetical protein
MKKNKGDKNQTCSKKRGNERETERERGMSIIKLEVNERC